MGSFGLREILDRKTHYRHFFFFVKWKEHYEYRFAVFLVQKWVMLRKVIELMANWRGQMGSRNILKVWRIAPLCLIWCIWRE
jgi:hypothetical protein